MYQSFIKPIFDFILALCLLVLTFPLQILVALGLAISQNGRIIFSQLRPGKDEKLFTIYKFKTMNDKVDSNGALLPDMERMTVLGSIIRNLSIDELPQLYNVLRGDMSFVGPRPLLKLYLPLYTAEQRARHKVKPGITGWAQVNGRNAITWTRKFELDIYYVSKVSFLLDIKILMLTLVKVVKRDGVNSNPSNTMEMFNGNN
ncbi:MAG: hypothetical protein RIQ89_2312 [Bacteroidota bacterium]|jgi:undecaprenyl phosphate N,N'-diacetylbacillosamine 1-phosphate transferase